MARVFWDTNLFIYLVEENPDWIARVVELRRRMLERGDQLLTSWLTVGEILTKPREAGDGAIERSYLRIFQSGAVEMIAFDSEAAFSYAGIRARNRVRPADAIQLACAAAAKTDLFISNDARLMGLSIPGITFITDLSRAPY